jgi:hypothetical protein
MTNISKCWLVVNAASGSNTLTSHQQLREQCEGRGLTLERCLTFPEDGLPSPADLTAARVDLLVIFAGDGTANAVLCALEGWGGKVLILPGGTMNLLAARVHRNLEMTRILDIVAHGGARATRISCVRCDAGTAFAGLLVGPGTAWNRVRESMRRMDLSEMAGEALEALRQTANGPAAVPVGVGGARAEGYPLIELSPGEHGIEIEGYFADDAMDYAEQAWATLRRRFREGPHDRLGIRDALVIASMDGSELPCLLDGEPARCPSSSEFRVEPSGVDLLATSHEY